MRLCGAYVVGLSVLIAPAGMSALSGSRTGFEQSVAPAESRPAALSGVAFDAATGLGVPGVVVSLQGGAVRLSRRAVTDSKGRFVFLDVPPSFTYSLRAAKPGYVSDGITRLSPSLASTVFGLASGEWMKDANILMLRTGGIGGRVIDERGEPIVGVPVRVFQRIPIAGGSKWATGPVATTDDRGEYRIVGLLPGTYLASVPSGHSSVPADTPLATVLGLTPMEAAGRLLPGVVGIQQSQSWLSIGNHAIPPRDSDVTYPSAFYSNARGILDATPIDLANGEHEANIDFILRPVPARLVAGRVIGPESVLKGLIVRLVRMGESEFGRGIEEASALVDVTGRFTMVGVPSGTYELRASTGFGELQMSTTTTLPKTAGLITTGNQRDFLPWLPGTLTTGLVVWNISGGEGYSVAMPVHVGEDGATDIVLKLERGATIQGRIVRDDGKPVPAAWEVQVDPANGSPALAGSLADRNSSGGLSGSFAFRGVQPGDYFLRVNAGSLIVKSITGPLGDLTQRPFTAASGTDIADVLITMTENSATLSGMVRDRQGNVIRHAAVLVFPTDPSLWSQFGRSPTRIRSIIYLGDQGYQVSKLQAGDYYVVAVDPGLRDEWQDAHFLKAAAAVGSRVTLNWGVSSVQDLVVQVVRK